LSNIPSVSIWCPPTYQTHLDSICNVLEGRLNLETHVHEGQDCSAIETALTAAPDRHVVIFYESLADALNRELGHLGRDATGENQPRIVVALEEWIAGNAALSALFYRHRQRVTLLPALGLLQAPGSVRDLLAARFCEGGVPEWDSMPVTEALLPPSVDPQFALMASAILQTAPDAQDARDQIEAISTPLEGVDPQLLNTPRTLERLLSEARSGSAPGFGVRARERHEDIAAQGGEDSALDLRRLQARHAQDLAALRRQSDALQIRLLDAVAQQTQLSDLAEQKQAEAAALRDLYQRDAKERDALGPQVEQLTPQLDTERAAFDDLTRRYDETRSGLERQIAGQMADIAALARDVQDRDRAVTDAQNLYDGLVRSSSWRITRPIRVIVRGLRRIVRR
jgi:hypothetical protein